MKLGMNIFFSRNADIRLQIKIVWIAHLPADRLCSYRNFWLAGDINFGMTQFAILHESRRQYRLTMQKRHRPCYTGRVHRPLVGAVIASSPTACRHLAFGLHPDRNLLSNHLSSFGFGSRGRDVNGEEHLEVLSNRNQYIASSG